MSRSGRPYNFITIFITVLLCGSALQAQNNTLYFMHSVPQAIHTNPALFYQCRTYIEIPVLSTLRYSYANTGFGYHDAIHYGSGSNADSLIIDMDNLEKKLKKRNYLRNEVSVNLLGAGFQLLDDYYVHFNISSHAETRVGYPGDLIALKDGNWDLANSEPRDIDLSGLGVNGTNYLQIAAGISTEISNGLYVGITLKYLKGAGNVNTRRANLTLETESDPNLSVRASADYSVRTSFPVQLSYDAQGYVSHVDFSKSFSNIIGDYILNNNRGAAIDIGLIYEYDDQLTLAASMVNLGFIHWASNLQQFDANASVDFEGFDLRAYAASGGSTDFLKALVDSVLETFQFETSVNPYFSTLTPKLYAGASYQLYPKVQVSALTRTELFDHRPHFALTLTGMYSPTPFLHGTLSYSMMNNKYAHLGFGLVLGVKGVQLYMVSDHIPIRWVHDTETGLVWPYNARTLNYRMGVNMVIGCENRDRGKSGGRPGSHRSGKYCPAYD